MSREKLQPMIRQKTFPPTHEKKRRERRREEKFGKIVGRPFSKEKRRSQRGILPAAFKKEKTGN